MNQRGLAIAAVVGTGVQVGAAIVATRREVGAEQGRKRFFFEKKKGDLNWSLQLPWRV